MFQGLIHKIKNSKKNHKAYFYSRNIWQGNSIFFQLSIVLESLRKSTKYLNSYLICVK